MPQTLYVAQFLLYFDAFWALLSVFTLGGIGLLGVLSLAAYVYGAYGIANERKRGYQVAVFAAFLPFLLRLVFAVTLGDGLIRDVGFILFSNSVLSVIFQYALIALLLHPMSRNHQKVWFS